MSPSDETKQKSNCLNQILQKNIGVILAVLLCAGVGIGLAGSYALSIKLIEAQAKQHARVTIDILSKTLALYSKTRDKSVKSVDHVELTPEYHTAAGAIPVPATVSIELGEQISDLKNGSVQNRTDTGGARDDFERQALAYLRQNPTDSFSRKEENNHQQVTLRYAEPVLMKASCVACHNVHPSSPKKDWKVGDVRGVIAVSQPLDEHLLMAREGLRYNLVTLGTIGLLAFFALSLVMSRLRLINTELEEKVEERTTELNRLANVDGLTQIANRRYFDLKLDEAWNHAVRTQTPISLLLCDVDFFKLYNDTYGHQAGDECLKTVAKTLDSSVCRGGDLTARYGGEEFAILLPTGDATRAAEFILQKLRESPIPHTLSEVKPYITLSIGVAMMIPSRYQTCDALIEAADRALYEAKERGRNCYVTNPKNLKTPEIPPS